MRKGDGLSPYDEFEVIRLFQDLLALDTQILNSVQAAGTESDWVDCEGKYSVVIAYELSGVNVKARIRIILKDKDGNRMYSERRRVENTGEQAGTRETGYYHGSAPAFKTFGATSYKLLLVGAVSDGGFLSAFSGEI